MNTADNQTNLEKYKKCKLIGKGGFGEVFTILNKTDNKIYAAKISNKEINPDCAEELLCLSREVNIISSIEHPAIIKFVEYSEYNFENEPKPVIITEYTENETLEDILDKQSKGFDPLESDFTKKVIIIFGIAFGMLYLHKNNILHRDLKPQNILLDENYYPKIADFGLSKIINDTHEKGKISSLVTVKGTHGYLAPEIIQTKTYSKKSDVFAFGIIMYKILNGPSKFDKYNPFHLQQEILKGNRPDIEFDVPEFYQNLIKKCWSQNPENRPSFGEIVDDLKILYSKGGKNNEEKAKSFYSDLSINKKFIKSIMYNSILNKLENYKLFADLPSETRHLIIMQFYKYNTDRSIINNDKYEGSFLNYMIYIKQDQTEILFQNNSFELQGFIDVLNYFTIVGGQKKIMGQKDVNF